MSLGNAFLPLIQPEMTLGLGEMVLEACWTFGKGMGEAIYDLEESLHPQGVMRKKDNCWKALLEVTNVVAGIEEDNDRELCEGYQMLQSDGCFGICEGCGVCAPKYQKVIA